MYKGSQKIPILVLWSCTLYDKILLTLAKYVCTNHNFSRKGTFVTINAALTK